MGRITASPRHVTDITGPDPLSLLKWGESNSKELEKMRYF